MRVIERIIVVAVCAIVIALASSCIERASDEAINSMCQQLVTLKGGPEAEPELNTKCKADAAHERTTQKVAECRSKAPDLDTFWNKCR